MRRLNLPTGWIVEANDAWIQGGIDAKLPFYLGTNASIENFRAPADFDVNGNFIGRGQYPTTVFLREMQLLAKAGYTLKGNYMIPPGG
ncbi:hypothetical protein [Sphingomonas albertensis]|uniref:Uncharacterized protein n=1 Tax=Sphingomonas albertensis TaxID=2762591 RepID=A0ABR7AI16_9SPHN|nr:hypothetical protein [Sphingomonas albertensis]MBC3940100.1 hypothetical protein [Sphingomonas albertensis]